MRRTGRATSRLVKAARRQADRERLEMHVGLPEQGGPMRFLLLNGERFAMAYVRIVFGDRGPYIEFAGEHIVARLEPHFAENRLWLPPEDGPLYYLWLQPVLDPNVRVYWQAKRVGYADYRRGMYYVAPDQLVLPDCRPRQAALF